MRAEHEEIGRSRTFKYGVRYIGDDYTRLDLDSRLPRGGAGASIELRTKRLHQAIRKGGRTHPQADGVERLAGDDVEDLKLGAILGREHDGTPQRARRVCGEVGSANDAPDFHVRHYPTCKVSRTFNGVAPAMQKNAPVPREVVDGAKAA